MAKICNGCGGVLGKECFNAQECEQIASNQYQTDLTDTRQLEEQNKILSNIKEIAENCPELNMDNYDESQAEELNNAMIEIVTLLRND